MSLRDQYKIGDIVKSQLTDYTRYEVIEVTDELLIGRCTYGNQWEPVGVERVLHRHYEHDPTGCIWLIVKPKFVYVLNADYSLHGPLTDREADQYPTKICIDFDTNAITRIW